MCRRSGVIGPSQKHGPNIGEHLVEIDNGQLLQDFTTKQCNLKIHVSVFARKEFLTQSICGKRACLTNLTDKLPCFVVSL